MAKKYGKSPHQRVAEALNQVVPHLESIIPPIGWDKITLQDAITRIIAELEKDRGEDSYYMAWQTAIAQCIKARLHREMETNRSFYISNWTLDDVTNQSAKMFLNSLCSHPIISERKKPNV